jgi:3-oxoacyl-[acyl-carrier-protein] synthase III
MKVGLEAVAAYLPDRIVRREDYAYLDAAIPPGMERIFRGPAQVRKMKSDDAVEIMAEKAATAAIARAGLQPSDIDFVIAGNIGGKYVIPMVGAYIHDKLQCRRETPVLNIQNVCAGFVDGLNVAWNLVKAGEYKRVLVVMVMASETRYGGIDLSVPIAKLFGDGAGAAIVSGQNLRCEFLSYYNETYGEIYDHDVVELQSNKNPQLLKESEIRVANYFRADEYMFEWQQRVGKQFAVNMVRKALEKAGLKLSDLNMILYHQAHDVFTEEWIDGGVEAGVARDTWKDTWDTYGNVGNVDIAANLVEFCEDGKAAPGSIIALFGPGAGGHSPCVIIRWLV